jgi:hypothetical protein
MASQSLIIDAVRRQAQTDRTNAGFGGRWDDGGAAALEAQVACWEAGKAGIIPESWKKLEAVKLLDPEYAEFKRLKQKFG